MRRVVSFVACIALAVGLVPAIAWATQNVVVSPHPIWESPRVMDGRVYSIVQAGGRIVVGGTFTTVRDYDSSTDQTRTGIFAFDPATGKIDPAFAPTFDKDVNAIVPAPDGTSVIVGGAFKTVNGVARQGLVKVSLADGSIDPTFTATTNNTVNDMALWNGRVIVGGMFRKLSGTTRERLGAIDATTGAIDAFNVPVIDSRDQYAPYIQELDVSPDSTRLVIVGNFLTVGAQPREQIAMIDLTTAPVSVADWATTLYNPDCASVYNDTYMRDVAFSPDSSYIVAVTTGAFFANRLCDTASRWEVGQTGTDLQPTWVTYTGGDTHWHVTITNAAVYVGGHQRWENNPNPSPGGDNDGPGSVSRKGIAALDPLSGVPLSWNPTRDRGRGVEAFLATDDYLYVGSDTVLFDNSVRQRLAILPTAGGSPNPSPDLISLPVNMYVGHSTGLMDRSTFDGNTVSAATVFSGPGLDGNNWSSARDGFVQNANLVYYGASSAYYRRTFNGTTFGTPTNLSTSVGYVDTNASLTPFDQPYNVDTTKTAAYKNGRIYYTRTNDTRLWWRWYSLESGIIGAQEYLASSADFSGATSLEVAGNWLYASWNDNKLYRFYVNGPVVDATSKTLVNDGNLSGRVWSDVTLMAFTQASGTGFEPPAPVPPPPLTCANDVWKAEYYANMTLTPPINTQRCEASINYDWGSGSPTGTTVGPDRFSVRWTTTHRVDARTRLSFTARADDGVRVWVDDQPVIQAWKDQSPTTYTGSIDVPAGDHTIRVEYYENGGGAVAQVSYTSAVVPDPPDIGIVTTDPLAPASGDVALHDQLVALGYDVDYLADSTVDSTATAAYDLIWVTGNARAGKLGNRLRTITQPVVVSKSFTYTAFNMATSSSTVKGTSITIADPSHPLAAGRSGIVTVASSQVTFGLGTPATSAAVVATINGTPAIFAYTPGQALTDGSAAPACRVALPYEFDSPASLTTDGRAFITAAASWSLGSACLPPGP